MAKWTDSESAIFNENDDTYETEVNMCPDEPIDLKQVNCDVQQEDTSSDWDTTKLLKSKAFRIKDILGLDENEKTVSSPLSSPNSLACKSATQSSMF